MGALGDSGKEPVPDERHENNETWQEFLSSARSSREKGELREAEDVYRLVKMNPDCVDAWTELCILARRWHT